MEGFEISLKNKNGDHDIMGISAMGLPNGGHQLSNETKPGCFLVFVGDFELPSFFGGFYE